MTKVIVLGQEPKEEKKLKPIRLVKYLHDNKFFNDILPEDISEFECILLLAKDYHSSGYDLMYAYDNKHINDSICNCLYLGHFNDGIVE